MGTEPYASTGGYAQPQTRERAVFGQAMGLVAFTTGFFAFGAYIGRDIGGGGGIALLIAALAAFFALNFVVRRSETLAIRLLFAGGLLLGMGLGRVLSYYAQTDPSALWQAGGATALFIAGSGAYGYATRRDLSHWAHGLFWALLALIAFGLVLVFVNIPGAHVIYAVLGLAVFAAYTILDLNRLRRAGEEWAVPIAAGIFLDVVNVFLFFLQLFGGTNRD